MDERWNADQPRAGPVRPPRPSQSLDYVGPSPRGSPRASSDLPSMFRTRKSVNYPRGASQLSNQLSVGATPSLRYSGTSTTGSERKGSFRKAVRKLLGKKQKQESLPVPDPSPAPPSRHGYHHSDPGAFMTQTPQSALPLRQHPPLPPTLRTFSSPHVQLADPLITRVRSPNALQFPKSAQLKPLDLGNPFYHRANHGPKRRATLPTLNLAHHEPDGVGTALGSPPDSGMGGMGPDTFPAIPESEIGLAVTTLVDKRRSRSANDLRQTMVLQQSPQRKRSEEIRFWRESFSGTVLLNPNTPPEIPDETDPMDSHVVEDDVAPRAEHLETNNRSVESVAASPHLETAASSAVLGGSRPATAGGDRTEDLERRVKHLETSLQDFQISLDRLTVGSRSNTHTPALEHQRAIRRQHTPSVLVDTLQDPSWRPASLDQYPRDSRYEDPGDTVEREWGGNSSATPAEAVEQQVLTPTEGTMRQGTFTALYNMLTDERAARHKLENEVRTLQREVTTMATRLERGSWNSYSVPVLPAQHRPRTPDESVRGASSHSAYDPRVVSRFSGSDSIVESEIYGLNNSRHAHRPESAEVQTPYELYRTPMEEHPSFGYRANEMF